MSVDKDDEWNLAKLQVDPIKQTTVPLPAKTAGPMPTKIRNRRKHFAKLPMTWYERMKGAHGQTYRVAWFLLYLHWKGNGSPIKLANSMLEMDGVPPTSKRRALENLERRGLITVERQPRKSPTVRLCI
jgi:hypothetical protein